MYYKDGFKNYESIVLNDINGNSNTIFTQFCKK